MAQRSVCVRNATAVWYQSIALGFSRVHADRYSPASGWGSSVIISDDTVDDDVHPPRLAVDDAGNAIVVYLNNAGNDDEIFAARYHAGLGWLTPVSIDATPGQARGNPDVAVNGSGDAVAVWSQRSNQTPPFDAWANLFD